MDMWIWVIAALVIALAIIVFVLSGPGMRKVTTKDAHHHAPDDHVPAPQAVAPAVAVAPAAEVAVEDEIPESVPVVPEAKRALSEEAPAEAGTPARHVEHGVVFEVPDAEGAAGADTVVTAGVVGAGLAGTGIAAAAAASEAEDEPSAEPEIAAEEDAQFEADEEAYIAASVRKADEVHTTTSEDDLTGVAEPEGEALGQVPDAPVLADAGDEAAEAAAVAAVAPDLGDLEHASSVEERSHLGAAAHGGGEDTAHGAEPVPYVPADYDPDAVAESARALGDLEHGSSVEERSHLGDAAHGGGEDTAHQAEPVPYVPADYNPDWQAEAEAAPEVEQVWDGPFGPGSAEANADGSGPRGWTVKAAQQTKVYLTPDIPVYSAAKANVWFVDEQRAIDAGFRRWDMPHK